MALERAPTAPATDKTKAPVHRIGKGSLLRFSHVSKARTTVGGEAAVCQ